MHKLKPQTEEQHCLQPHLQNVTEFQAWNILSHEPWSQLSTPTHVTKYSMLGILFLTRRLWLFFKSPSGCCLSPHLNLPSLQYDTKQFAPNQICSIFFSFWSLLSSNQSCVCVYINIYSISVFIRYMCAYRISS
jgi:hypothetical protein